MKIYVLGFRCWDSPVTYYFSTEKKAKEFSQKYDPKYPWTIDSYEIDLKNITKDDEMWFKNTKIGKELIEKNKKDKAKWFAQQAKKDKKSCIVKV
jgi:hypothetical protein